MNLHIDGLEDKRVHILQVNYWFDAIAQQLQEYVPHLPVLAIEGCSCGLGTSIHSMGYRNLNSGLLAQWLVA